MTNKVDVISQNSTFQDKIDHKDNIVKNLTSKKSPKKDSLTDVNDDENLKSEIIKDQDSVSPVNMTKNNECGHSSENNDDKKVTTGTENFETTIENKESQNTEERGDTISTTNQTEECTKPLTSAEISEKEENERQLSVEEKSHPSPWSFSQWSENYESLEDEKQIEDISGDPEKLILWAAEKNELETLRKLLEENPKLINARDNDLYTPLHRASYSNNVEVIKILLSYDADISSKTADGWEPLHCACKWDSVEAVSLLLQNGAEVNARTKGNITPLHLAASNASGRRTLELLLWQPYIDPNIKNDAGDTAYDIAYRTGPLGALFEILEESVNVY